MPLCTDAGNFMSKAFNMSNANSECSETEKLLGQFPVNELELNVLFTAYDRFGKEGLDGSWSALHQNVDHQSAGMLNAETETLLPELSQIFQISVATVFVTGYGAEDEALCRKAKFLEACVSLLGRRGDRFLLDAIYTLAASRQGNEADGVTPSPSGLASLVYRLCRLCRAVQSSTQGIDCSDVLSAPEPPQSWIAFFSTVTKSQASEVSQVEWKEWANRMIPNVPRAMSTAFHYCLLGCECQLRLQPPFQGPRLADGRLLNSQLWSGSVGSPIPMQLALMDLGGPWCRIFSSDENGLSFRAFQDALTSFCGPTVILIRTVEGDRLGYFSAIPWKTSPKWFTGQGDSFLFRLHPSWNVYHPAQGGCCKFHQFLNTPASYRKDCLAGLAVGGVAPNLPRLHITTSLENCKACAFGSVFETGPLLANEDTSYFEIDCLEVFAVRIVDSESYEQGVQAGKLKAAVKESVRQQFATVDRKQFVDDFRSGAYINNLFAHQEQTRGRASFVVDETGGGYHIEEKPPFVGERCED